MTTASEGLHLAVSSGRLSESDSVCLGLSSNSSGEQAPMGNHTQAAIEPLIADLSVKDQATAALWKVATNLQVGLEQYGDRRYYFLAKLPDAYAGSDWIQTPMDAKNYANDPLVTFRVTAVAEVCVAFDDRVADKPTWLKEWMDTGDDIVNTEPIPRTFSIFKKGFSANSVVTLGRNGQRGNHGGQYMVFVRRPGQKPEVAPLRRSFPVGAVEGKSASVRRYGRGLTAWLRRSTRDEVPTEPTKRSCFERLKRAGVMINTVVDVGVEDGTPELIQAYPQARHLLIEPLTSHNPQIEAAYAGVPHEIYNMACSNEDGTCWLIATSVHASGRATHAHIDAAPAKPGSGSVVGCEPIRRVRLDSLGLPLGEHILLKVDVDGEDLEVPEGGGGSPRPGRGRGGRGAPRLSTGARRLSHRAGLPILRHCGLVLLPRHPRPG